VLEPQFQEKRVASRPWADEVRSWFSVRANRWVVGWAVAATASLVLVLVRGERKASWMESSDVSTVGLALRGSSEAEVALSADGRSAIIALGRPPVLAETDSVDVELLGPDGAAAAELRGRRISDVTLPRVLILRSADPLREGRYKLRITPRAAAREPIEIRLTLRRSYQAGFPNRMKPAQ
jgi:hypothetical protein